MALRDQLIRHLIRTAPPKGARFHSEGELSGLAKLSRPTVRRALHDLERDGWIERRQGSGTFIGPRGAVADDKVVHWASPREARQTLRLAVIIHLLGDFGHDLYAGRVIRGIDAVAEEHGITIEMLGDREGDVKSVSRRLLQTRPDVLAFTAPPPRHTMLICEAQRLGIPSIGTGSLLPTLGVPSACEDGAGGAAMAVRHLVERGHRRIGFVSLPYSVPWVFERRSGYIRGCEAAGLEADEGMVLWLPGGDEAANDAAMERYLERRKPTALLFSSSGATSHLASQVRSGRLSVPGDLSVVTFDEYPSSAGWLGGVRPTVVGLPLEQMGSRLAAMARNLVDGREASTEYVPCELLEGDSVAAPAAGGT